MKGAYNIVKRTLSQLAWPLGTDQVEFVTLLKWTIPLKRAVVKSLVPGGFLVGKAAHTPRRRFHVVPWIVWTAIHVSSNVWIREPANNVSVTKPCFEILGSKSPASQRAACNVYLPRPDGQPNKTVELPQRIRTNSIERFFSDHFLSFNVCCLLSTRVLLGFIFLLL